MDERGDGGDLSADLPVVLLIKWVQPNLFYRIQPAVYAVADLDVKNTSKTRKMNGERHPLQKKERKPAQRITGGK